MKIKILLVEDDLNLGLVISDQLTNEGYSVSLCADGVEALKLFNEENFSLCICDIMMPKKDGFTLVGDIRNQNAEIPILILSAKSMTEDKVTGFNMGADDYLTKPFSVEELQMRVKALLKRIHIKVDKPEEKIILLGRFTFDIENSILRSKSECKNLTKKEAQILKILYKFKNNVIPREVILNAVWGQDDYFVGRSLDVFISKLRKYLKDESNIHISNIHGIGFKLEIQE